MEKKILIFGGTGTIGFSIAKKMKEDGKRLGVKTWFTKPLTPKRIEILLTTIGQLIKKYN